MSTLRHPIIPENSPAETETGFFHRDRGAGTYLVSLAWGPIVRTFKWNAEKPVPLDHPATHYLTKQNDSFYLVKATPGSHEPMSPLARFPLPDPDAKSGEWYEYEDFGPSPLRLKFAKVARARAAYMPTLVAPSSYSPEGVLYASCGVHEFLSAFETLASRGTFSGQIESRRVFTLQRTTKNTYVTALYEGLTLKLKGQPPRYLPANEKLSFRPQDLQGAKIAYHDYWWRFNKLSTPVFSRSDQIDERSEEFYSFRRSLIAVLAFVAIGFGLAKALPEKPKVEELIKQATTVQLKQPHLLPPVPEPKPTAKPTPKPPAKPTPKPTPKPTLKPALPPAPIAKPKALPAPKPQAKPKPASVPKPQAKPKSVTPLRTPTKPKIVSMAQPKPMAPTLQPKTPEVTRPKPAPVVAKGPTPEQIKAAVEEKARAQVAQSLGFLSTTPSKSAPKRNAGNTSPDSDRHYATEERSAGGMVGKSSELRSTANAAGSSSNGPLSTRGARSIASTSGISGRNKSLNDVQGRVSLASLSQSGGTGSLGGSKSFSVSGKGSLEEAKLLQALQKHLEKFQYCYEKALLTHPNIGGTLSMEWQIGVTGTANSIQVVRSDLNDGALHQCVTRELGKIPFPKPAGGSVTVKYPFAFTSSSL
ncbi:MAG: AgmX/PglI C-terminal domain-containing protein [Cryobacterium sp.]|nr:AgmX/PglI C-terminal domain-containing protein [Oligoflexia bacterium]